MPWYRDPGSPAYVAGLIAMWYASSVVTSITTKHIMRGFPFPITLALVQQAVAALGGLSDPSGGGGSATALLRDWRRHCTLVGPAAATLVVALVSYRWSLMSVSVMFTHTVKTLGPVFTIGFSRLLLGERLPTGRYLAVLPIILGVAITTATEAEFFLVGFFAATTSTASSALQSVLAKRILRERELAKGEFFSLVCFFSCAALLPLFLVIDAWRLHPMGWAAGAAGSDDWLRTARWLLFNAGCSFVNQYAGLSVLDALSSPLSHALANVMKRAAVISIAMFWASRPVTPLHLVGVSVSLGGALAYQRLDRCCPEACLAGGTEHGDAADAGYARVPLQIGAEQGQPQAEPMGSPLSAPWGGYVGGAPPKEKKSRTPRGGLPDGWLRGAGPFGVGGASPASSPALPPAPSAA